MGANLLTYMISAIYLSLRCLHTQAYTPEGILATHKCYTFKVIHKPCPGPDNFQQAAALFATVKVTPMLSTFSSFGFCKATAESQHCKNVTM